MRKGIIKGLKTFSGHIVRSVISNIPVSFYNDHYFEQGVSLTILTKNDPWFAESLVSVYTYADEIIIIDSSDETDYINYNRLIIDKLRKKVDIKYYSEDIRITQARRKAKEESSREIIVHWDADMIAIEDGPSCLGQIIDEVKSVKVKKVVYFPLLTPYYVLSRVTTYPLDIEGWIFSNTSKELYRPRSGDPKSEKFVEGFSPPKYFKRIAYNSVAGVHMKYMMPSDKALYKKYEGYLLNDKFMEKFGNYDTLKRQLPNYSADAEPSWGEYDEHIHGKYPVLLRRFFGLSLSEIVKVKIDEIKNLVIPKEVQEKIDSSRGD